MFKKMLTLLRSKLANDVAPVLGCSPEKVLSLLEIPKDVKFGHLSVPVFWLAKELKKAPPLIAIEFATALNGKNFDYLDKVEPVAGFINFYFKPEVLFKNLNEQIKNESHLGYGQKGAGKKVVIDYSSPNVAKPMHVGHLRATVIGQAIRNLAETQGYNVIGLNHLGDWGSQFGKLAWAYKKWGHEFPFDKNAFESLYGLYVKFHQEVEAHPEYEQEGAITFKKLEEGDPEVTALWKKFIEISMKDFDEIWKRLGVKHDLVRGESFYNDRLDDVVKRLQAKNLLIESEGAQVVDLTAEGMAPCLIRKSDGASLYATRDLASAFYRHEELKSDLNLYVVGIDQNFHFKQVFTVLKKMGYEWADQCQHIGFGMIRFKDGEKISSRKGNIIRFKDVLNQAVELVKDIIRAKNPNIINLDLTAEQVAVGAITFNDLVNDRVKNVEFDWDRALSFDGDSGPYVQYCHVRCVSILRKYGKEVPTTFAVTPTSTEEVELMKKLLEYELALSNAFQQMKPNIIANYLLEVCAIFNRFYQNHRIIGGDESLAPARIALVNATRVTLKQGLKVLNIAAPEEM
ncbi:MAG: arginine--tRNA ligase [Bdellovibrionota bacterium]